MTPRWIHAPPRTPRPSLCPLSRRTPPHALGQVVLLQGLSAYPRKRWRRCLPDEGCSATARSFAWHRARRQTAPKIGAAPFATSRSSQHRNLGKTLSATAFIESSDFHKAHCGKFTGDGPSQTEAPTKSHSELRCGSESWRAAKALPGPRVNLRNADRSPRRDRLQVNRWLMLNRGSGSDVSKRYRPTSSQRKRRRGAEPLPSVALPPALDLVAQSCSRYSSGMSLASSRAPLAPACKGSSTQVNLQGSNFFIAAVRYASIPLIRLPPPARMMLPRTFS